MRNIYKLYIWSSLALTGLFVLSACGGNDITCGQNTTNQNGRCVLVDDQAVGCGPSARVTDNGTCVPDKNGCGPGTAFSADQGQCVPANDTCAEGATFNPDSQTCVAATDCGTNTVNEDGTCVVDTDALCSSQPGVTFNSDTGRCEIASDSCGPGTTRSAESGNCVIADDSCADGLAINDQGRCVATGDICNEDSTFKRIGGEPACVPDITCNEGDVVLNTDSDPSTPGLCVSPAEKLAANADAEDSEISNPMANNDPESGTPDTLSTKPVGQTAAYNGVIQPGDTQDVDAFSFMGTEGQWFNLSVQSTGLPQPWFRITGPDGYERQATYGLESDPARTIAIPRDGEYTVSIQPTMAKNERFDTVYGDSDWSYVAGLEQIDPPAVNNSVDVSQNNVTGNLANLTDNLTTLQGLSGAELATIEANAAGADAQAALQFWSSTTDFTTGDILISSDSDPRTVKLPSNSSPIAIPDWISADGPGLEYDISITPITNSENLGSVAADSSEMSSTQTVMAENSFYFIFEAQAGQVIEMTQTNNENAAADVTISDSVGNIEAQFDELDVPAQRTDDEDYGDGYFYVQQNDTFVAEVTAPSNSGLTNLQATFNSKTPNDFGQVGRDDAASGTITEAIASGRSAFHTITFDVNVLANLTINAVAPTGDETLNIKLRPAGERTVAAEIEDDGEVSARELPIDSGEYVVQVGAPQQIGEYDVELDTVDTFVEDEPNDAQVNASSPPIGSRFDGVAAPNGDTDWWQFTIPNQLAANETLAVRAIGDYDSGAWECALRNASGDAINPQGSISFRENGCAFYAAGLDSGDYFLEISNSDDESLGYTGSAQIVSAIEETEPNDQRTNASAYPMNLLPSERQAAFGLHYDNNNDTTDWYEVSLPSTLPSGKDLIVGVDGYGPEKSIDEESCFFGFCFGGRLSYGLYDNSGNQIGSTNTWYDDYFTRSASDLSGGDTYYIQTERPNPGDAEDHQYFVNAQLFGPDQSNSGASGVTIPNNDPAGITDTVSVSNCATVEDAFVEVDISGDRRGDYNIYITGPSGDSSLLETQFDNFDNAELDDLLELYPVTELPVAPMPFDGQTGNGMWTLEVSDTFGDGGDGTLNSWTLHLNCQ
jgi:subtilisin-like proprotein convertase family protein